MTNPIRAITIPPDALAAAKRGEVCKKCVGYKSIWRTPCDACHGKGRTHRATVVVAMEQPPGDLPFLKGVWVEEISGDLCAWFYNDDYIDELGLRGDELGVVLPYHVGEVVAVREEWGNLHSTPVPEESAPFLGGNFPATTMPDSLAPQCEKATVVSVDVKREGVCSWRWLGWSWAGKAINEVQFPTIDGGWIFLCLADRRRIAS